ncbi:MAG: protein-glutamate O-methyltransferase CheR [Rubrivivax sp.]|nr:MAG: protein-glutamate O-methyltransferase CheR [Rubrivivax sp.]
MQTITDQEFSRFQQFIHEAAGISMASSKKALVSGRLAKRLQARQLKTFTEYFNLLSSGKASDEVQTAIDLLTTNETYFFREPKHFDLLRQVATASTRPAHQPFRIWSAASSSGEEAYSMAMVLADCLGTQPWEVLGTDISTRVLQRARTGHFSMERSSHIPPAYLKRYCLKGIGEQAGTLLVDRSLRERVKFTHANLNEDLPKLGQFDMIFLRNVMIYFNGDTKRQVVARVLSLLKPGGHFCIGHSESLNDITDAVTAVAPSIYLKP